MRRPAAASRRGSRFQAGQRRPAGTSLQAGSRGAGRPAGPAGGASLRRAVAGGEDERLSATWKARIERERTFSLFSFPRASFPAPDAISARALPRRTNFAVERVVRLRAALRACAPRNRRRGADLRRLVAAPA